MIIAINEENKRIPPFKNVKGRCECCNELVIAHCGEIRKYHWQHKSLKDCDSWKETETEWHINWKNKFPIENQEVIIEKNYKKHRADIRTSARKIIEFQNSAISSTTIKERESFYGDMIWVLNGNKFKSNLRIRSAEEIELKKFTELSKNELQDYRLKLESDYNILPTKNRIIEFEIEELEKKIFQLNLLINKITVKSPELIGLENKDKIEFENYVYHIPNLKKKCASLFNDNKSIERKREEFKYHYLTELKNSNESLERYHLQIESKKKEIIKNSQHRIPIEENELYKNYVQKIEERKVEISNNYKDFYTYKWKHKRQSWDYAEKPIFLDFGKEFLYEIINGETLKKCTKIDFIQKFS